MKRTLRTLMSLPDPPGLCYTNGERGTPRFAHKNGRTHQFFQG